MRAGTDVKDDLQGRPIGKISIPALGRRSVHSARFNRVDETPPSPTCSSITIQSNEDIDSSSQSSSSCAAEEGSAVLRANTPQQGSFQQKAGRRIDMGGELHSSNMLSFDSKMNSSSSLSSVQRSSPYIVGAPSTSQAQESEAALEFIDNLEDIEESYMLSVFWNAGDSATYKQGTGNDSVAGNTRCSFASTNTASTSMTNYTWSSSRPRHRGAYKNRSRVVKNAPKASWIDTMEDSSAQHLGFTNSWSATRGWTQAKAREWDPTPDPSIWESLDSVFDHGERRERVEI